MSGKPDRIRVGMVGAGGIACAHYGGFDSEEGRALAEIYALCEVREETLSSEAKKRGIPPERCFTDYLEMMKLEELDAVDICTPNRYHHGPAVAAARAGKHILCEKPMSVSGRLAQEMVDAAEEAGVILQVGCHRRFDPGARALKRYVEAGELGEIYHARAVTHRRRGIPGGSFIRKDAGGIGVLGDMGVHIVDKVLWLCGYPRPTVALGTVASKIGNREGYIALWGGGAGWLPEEFEVEDFAAGLVKFETGMQLVIEACWAANVDTFGPSYILGTDGGCIVEPPKIFGQKHGTVVDVQPVVRDKGSAHAAEVIAFLEAVRDGRPSPVPGSEVVVTSHIFDAIYESARTGREVKVSVK
jgi:predicted dehydrogenase